MVEDGANSHKIVYVTTFKEIQMASKLYFWVKSYRDFAEQMDLAYWWSFSAGGSAINGKFFSTNIIRL